MQDSTMETPITQNITNATHEQLKWSDYAYNQLYDTFTKAQTKAITSQWVPYGHNLGVVGWDLIFIELHSQCSHNLYLNF